MLLLTCPNCGLSVEETELAPGGQAHLKRFGPESTDEQFEEYMFLRDNAKGVHFERWRHAYGCGKWFLAARDTSSLQVYGTYSAQTTEPPADILARIAKGRSA
ncbi:sarcosine oxidase subunit delta [Jannaschia helgolandensis]|uniref:sarcosine oxidase subunit delta n=1 Tax=Jannaschia helgolandensis TaxID=188906 RepID=UPI0030D84064|tara:strand:- start:5930 stop:6238 length:309 start_codon:yes stop_codon:yes gene_type:complete